MRGTDPYPYDRGELRHDLAAGGMTYDEFDQLYGMDVVEADTAVRDLQSSGYTVERRDRDRGRVWELTDPLDELEP